ncbi:hypothetical protein ACFFSH_32890 [Streptomyces filamentosus]|uniref:Uncharacterized protein n=1 Tax=Streptomyces filamentosus TaxID=67294 RepID=A0A919BBD3_STRFL|nr:hypothetical protein [Streptomyces filamentosus]GHF77704.1 hypothetical protein GCM10017667_01240 [Streptomyces filamentosus]
MTEPSRHWDGAGLERKIRAAGRSWTVGAQSGRWPDEEMVVEHRVAAGRRVELTVEELARAVGVRTEDADRDEDLA